MRSKLFSALTALVLGLATVPPGLPAEDVTITVIPVTDQITMLSGNGSNIGLFKGDKWIKLVYPGVY